jgi:hypothetical protein
VKSACGASRGEGAGAIRLPLGNLLPAELQVQVWLSWLAKEGVLEDREPTGTLVCRSGGRSRAVLFFRDLRQEDFLLLHPTATDYEFVEEAATPSAGEPPAEPAGENGSDAAPPVPEPPGWGAPLLAFLRAGKDEG